MTTQSTRSRSRWPLALGLALAAAGCAPHVGGNASFPVLAKGKLPGYEPVAQVDEKRCSHVVLFIAWGEDQNHEALVTDLLERHKGDAIVDAELTYWQIPAFVYHQLCARVKGTVVRRSGGPVASAPTPVLAVAREVGR